jgi:hypothetical protein
VGEISRGLLRRRANNEPLTLKRQADRRDAFDFLIDRAAFDLMRSVVSLISTARGRDG